MTPMVFMSATLCQFLTLAQKKLCFPCGESPRRLENTCGRGKRPFSPHPRHNPIMKSLLRGVCRFLVSEDGPTAVEYAVMLSLIVIVCLSAISTIGVNANSVFHKLASSVR
jgi:pilus assembly protein Flp/PilA